MVLGISLIGTSAGGISGCSAVDGLGSIDFGSSDSDSSAVKRLPPGQVITQTPFPVNAPPRAQRVVFSSTGARDHRQTAVSGTVLQPYARWSEKSPRPLAVIAPGTLGMADNCASSVALRYEAPPTPPAPQLLAQGWNVAIVDYQGLGTPGVHPYLNREVAGNNTLDMARAAIETLQLPADTPIALFGYSQGGGATAAAAELADEYASELNIRAVYAGAIPADLTDTALHIRGSALAGLVGYFMNGLIAEYPETKEPIERMLSPLGQDFLKLTADECIGATVERWPRNDTKAFTANDLGIAENLRSPELSPAVRRHVDEQALGTKTPSMPVFVTHNALDDVLPVTSARELVQKWQKAGADITYVEVDTDLGDGTHGLAYVLTHEEMLAWVNQKMGY
ncbi:triacylglycerol lipase [Corynebacterium sp. HMSC14B06]|uniref:lipase family protein n=1 Tax=Corynebacterium sp. HMSC14B06 TaxID=1581098 RepID=UPI0008A1F929|nr:lipase family protein [Corynebacterium sp. HMSC14B06]OFT69512.1 triacylglycerol lipase [Corynebacterium sp. HMSC14B06]